MTDLLADAIWDGDPDTRWGAETEAAAISDRLDALAAHVCCGRECPHPSHAQPLATEAKARTSDPSTSHVAAASKGENLRSDQMAVLSVIQSMSQPWTYDWLVRMYVARAHDGTVPMLSQSGIRSRAKELRDARFIEPAGTGKADTGRPAKLWRVTNRTAAAA